MPSGVVPREQAQAVTHVVQKHAVRDIAEGSTVLVCQATGAIDAVAGWRVASRAVAAIEAHPFYDVDRIVGRSEGVEVYHEDEEFVVRQ
jgi:hypothetical protein